MPNLNSKLLGGAAVALLAAMFSAPAQAAPASALYTGGGTLAEKVYRDVMNCYGATSSGDTTVGLAGFATGCNAVTSYNSAVELLYVGVGSGNGKKSLIHHDSSLFVSGARTPDNPPVASTSDFGPFYGSGTGASWVPSSSSGLNFPTVSFIGSDDPLTAPKAIPDGTSDIEIFQATSLGNFGGTNAGGLDLPNQLPGLITVVAVPFHPTVTWNPHGATVSGASSHVSLATDTVCGIFTGAISDWSDPAFKAANGNQTLGNGTIKVSYRSDSSGTTFLFSNALIHQCGSQTNPRTGITHPVPDQWLTDNGIANTAGLGPDGIGASNNSFFITVNTAGHLPTNFTGNSGSGGVKTYLNATIGAAGYVSPDFVQNVDASGPQAANLETWASFLAGGTAKYLAPIGKNGTSIVGSLAPPSKVAHSCTVATTYAFGTSPDGICQDNPINWGRTFPTPTATSAYPIGGFTFIDTYKCQASATDTTNLVGTIAGSLGYLRWYYGSTTENTSHVKTELTNNGFALIPGSWISAIKAMLTTNAPTKIQTAGSTGKCLTASGA
jgi:phosphate transport system substrate-binding protein